MWDCGFKAILSAMLRNTLVFILYGKLFIGTDYKESSENDGNDETQSYYAL